MSIDIHSALQRLTAQPNSDYPFLSIYLDWQPDGSGKRPVLLQLQQELDSIAGRVDKHGESRASFEADRERLQRYLEVEAPPEANGLAIFACHAEGIWEVLELQAPVETRIIEDRQPHLFQLARILDDYETAALVLADSQESYILVVSLNEVERAGETQASEQIKRFDAGGWAQMLFQRRTENLVKAHTRDIAGMLQQVMERYQARHVIVASNDSVKGHILESLPDELKERMLDFIHLDKHSDWKTIMEKISPMLRKAERRQEAEDVAELEAQAYEGGLGVLGISETALALSKGQVHKLLMLSSFNATGGECPNCLMLRPGLRSKCPYDGAELREVTLRESFIARALQQNALIQVVEQSDYLAQHEEVGALLRYRDSGQEQQLGA